ncbi:hypothetical protein FF1_027559 [Malus domestica]|uniref:Uncharacterized protein n=1 Tax=Malus domestica TaxID=3750 RepID=A0A498KHW0_MALDO|nr:hypothetical protein DVH24_026122 [Malus domestica]
MMLGCSHSYYFTGPSSPSFQLYSNVRYYSQHRSRLLGVDPCRHSKNKPHLWFAYYKSDLSSQNERRPEGIYLDSEGCYAVFTVQRNDSFATEVCVSIYLDEIISRVRSLVKLDSVE